MIVSIIFISLLYILLMSQIKAMNAEIICQYRQINNQSCILFHDDFLKKNKQHDWDTIYYIILKNCEFYQSYLFTIINYFF